MSFLALAVAAHVHIYSLCRSACLRTVTHNTVITGVSHPDGVPTSFAMFENVSRCSRMLRRSRMLRFSSRCCDVRECPRRTSQTPRWGARRGVNAAVIGCAFHTRIDSRTTPARCRHSRPVVGPSVGKSDRRFHHPRPPRHHPLAPPCVAPVHRWIGFRLDVVSAVTLSAGSLLAVIMRNTLSPAILGLAMTHVLQLTGYVFHASHPAGRHTRMRSSCQPNTSPTPTGQWWRLPCLRRSLFACTMLLPSGVCCPLCPSTHTP